MIRNERSDLTGDERGVAGSGPAGRQQWRTIVAVLLIVVGCVLAPLVGVAVWGPVATMWLDRSSDDHGAG